MATPAIANNNPGNLRPVGGSGSFQSFSSPQEGFAALLNDLQGKMTGNTRTGLNGNSTLSDLISKYAPATDNNTPAQYATFVANKLGTTPNAQLKDLQPRIGELANAIATFEDTSNKDKFKPLNTVSTITNNSVINAVKDNPKTSAAVGLGVAAFAPEIAAAAGTALEVGSNVLTKAGSLWNSIADIFSGDKTIGQKVVGELLNSNYVQDKIKDSSVSKTIEDVLSSLPQSQADSVRTLFKDDPVGTFRKIVKNPTKFAVDTIISSSDTKQKEYEEAGLNGAIKVLTDLPESASSKDYLESLNKSNLDRFTLEGLKKAGAKVDLESGKVLKIGTAEKALRQGIQHGNLHRKIKTVGKVYQGIGLLQQLAKQKK